jgi:hypothetical protein
MGFSDWIELLVVFYTNVCPFAATRRDGQHGCTTTTATSKVKERLLAIFGHCMIMCTWSRALCQPNCLAPVLQNSWQNNYVRIGPVSEAALSAIVFVSMIADRPMEMAIIVSDPKKSAVHDRLMFR